MVGRLMKGPRKVGAHKDVEPRFVPAYRKAMIGELAGVAAQAIAQARKEVPKARDVRLADDDIEDLPEDVRVLNRPGPLPMKPSEIEQAIVRWRS